MRDFLSLQIRNLLLFSAVSSVCFYISNLFGFHVGSNGRKSLFSLRENNVVASAMATNPAAISPNAESDSLVQTIASTITGNIIKYTTGGAAASSSVPAGSDEPVDVPGGVASRADPRDLLTPAFKGGFNNGFFPFNLTTNFQRVKPAGRVAGAEPIVGGSNAVIHGSGVGHSSVAAQVSESGEVGRVVAVESSVQPAPPVPVPKSFSDAVHGTAAAN
ncbi:hypothetical protein OROGR_002490 [Orobanche gracilis]